MIYIGIDNGVTGTIGCLGDKFKDMIKTPVVKVRDYQKEKNFTNRINVDKFLDYFEDERFNTREGLKVFIERPMVNPKMFLATKSALRSLEATLVCIEMLGWGYQFIDSKGWQKAMLPVGTKGSKDLKQASMEVGIELFPEHEAIIKKHKDADGLLIAEWARREGL